jgi:arylsulfatase A-like enzyme/Tfp pilus assembly protein PilF
MPIAMSGRTRRKWIVPLLVLVLAIAGAAVWFLRPPGATRPPIRNVVIISIDTCRADYLGCYNPDRPLTPNIDKVAREGILFENVISPVPLTLPAHSSMMTGTIPPTHGVQANGTFRLSPANLTLAEILSANGFATGAVVSTFVLDSQFGLDQGFDTYHDEFETTGNKSSDAALHAERGGGETTRIAVDWLDRNKDSKFFLFLHYYDPHEEYEPPEPYASRYADNPYAGEIAYTDELIGRFLDRLKALGLDESTLVIVTSDHGEMLGEHGEETHQFFIYQSAIRVPLIFRLPGGTAPVRVAEPAGLIDIVPTVCGLLGLKRPANVQGVDLSAAFEEGGAALSDRALYCESFVPTTLGANPLRAVVERRYKFIQTTRAELYDIIEDPGESVNLVLEKSRLARDLQDRLRRILKDSLLVGGDAGLGLSAQDRARLASLGYVGGTMEPRLEFDPGRDDPKDVIGFHEDYLKATALIRAGEYDAARTQLEALQAQRPDYQIVYGKLGEVAVAQGRLDDAVTHFERALELNPQDTNSHAQLAVVLTTQGKLEPAMEHAKIALKNDPNCITALIVAGDILNAQHNFDEAEAYYEGVLKVDPRNTDGLSRLGSLLQKQNRHARAVELYRKSLEILPDQAEIMNNLSWIASTSSNAALRNPAKALKLAQQACSMTGFETAPHLDTLAAAYAATGDFKKAVEWQEKAIELAVAAGRTGPAQQWKRQLEIYRQGRPLVP